MLPSSRVSLRDALAEASSADADERQRCYAGNGGIGDCADPFAAGGVHMGQAQRERCDADRGKCLAYQICAQGEAQRQQQLVQSTGIVQVNDEQNGENDEASCYSLDRVIYAAHVTMSTAPPSMRTFWP